jgi:hypothetical protein
MTPEDWRPPARRFSRVTSPLEAALILARKRRDPAEVTFTGTPHATHMTIGRPPS